MKEKGDDDDDDDDDDAADDDYYDTACNDKNAEPENTHTIYIV